MKIWNDIKNHYSIVILDEYIIMPNHVHGIIIIGEDNYYNLCRDTACRVPTTDNANQTTSYERIY